MSHNQNSLSPELSELERETIESLLDYPEIGKLFDPASPQNYERLKKQMQSTMGEIERVIRRGSPTDAAKAQIIADAYRTTIVFLDELEARRANS